MMDFNCLCWNTGGVPYFSKFNFDSISKYLHGNPAEVLCLQELTNLPTKLTAISLGNNSITTSSRSYSIAVSSHSSLITTKFPIINTGSIDFNDIKPCNSNCAWATLSIKGKKIRIYNSKLGIIGVGIAERNAMLQTILKHASKANLPVIVCGDMNTTIPKKGFKRKIVQLVHREPTSSMFLDGKYIVEDERYSFAAVAKKYGFKDCLKIETPTWALPHTSLELFNLKLDWFFVKRLEGTAELGPYITDHRPIHVQCKL